MKAAYKGEELSGDNKFFCEKCNEKKDAIKGAYLGGMSKYISIYVNRFGFDYETFQRIKLKELFTFPEEINMKDYMKEEEGGEQSTLFDLFGIIIHRGTPYAGHYYCVVKDIENKANKDKPKFFEMNDTVVREVEDDYFQQFYGRKDDVGYILYYRRREEGDDIDQLKFKMNPNDLIYKEVMNKNKTIAESRAHHDKMQNFLRADFCVFEDFVKKDFIDTSEPQICKFESDEFKEFKRLVVPIGDAEGVVKLISDEFKIDINNYELFEVTFKYNDLIFYKNKIDIQLEDNKEEDTKEEDSKKDNYIKYGGKYVLVNKSQINSIDFFKDFQSNNVG